MSDDGVTKGDRFVKMLDVAAAAGVSRSTVSNVMREHPAVAAEVRSRVIQEAERLGYVYNRAAGGLRMQRSHLIGLVVPDLANPFIGEAILGIQESLSARGYLLVSASTGDQLDRQAEVLRTLAEHRLDGFLLLPAIASDAETLSRGLNGLATVLLNRNVAEADVAHVGPDDVRVGRLGASHLVEAHSCRTVAYFGGPALAWPRVLRGREFRRIAELSGAEVVESWAVPSEATARAGYAIAKCLIEEGDIPEGVHCHSDEIAYGVLRALREDGIPIDRCRIIGTDDVPDAAFANPTLSSISVDAFAIGQVAAGMLLEQLDEQGDSLKVPPPHFVGRQSCGCEGARP